MALTKVIGAGIGTTASLADSNMPAGSVLQVLQATNDTDVALANNITTLSTAIELAITPSATSSKIFIFCACAGDANGGHYRALHWRLLRASTEIFQNNYHMYDANEQNHNINVNHIRYLDSPSTTSAVTYKLQARHMTGSSVSDTYDGYVNRYNVTVINLMEIAG